MSSELNLIATRYADALFALASEKNQHDAVKKDMETLNAAFAQSNELNKFLVNPILSREAAQQAVSAILDAMKASELTRKFFDLLVREFRLEIAPAAVKKYLELLAKSRNELTVNVTSATPLSKEQITAIADAVAKSTGRKVSVETTENPALIGGVQVRVGSQMLDYSVAGKLERLRMALTKAA